MGISLISFLKGKRSESIKESVPGPGAYKIPCTFGEAPNYDKQILTKSAEFLYV
jgi:hypothetical protein